MKVARFQLGEDKVREGSGLQILVMHQPPSKGPRRARVRLNSAGRPQRSPGGGHLRLPDLVEQKALVLGEQIVLEQSQGQLVPLDCFWKAVVASLIL